MKNSLTAQQKKQMLNRLMKWTEWFLGRNDRKPIPENIDNVRLKASDFQCY